MRLPRWRLIFWLTFALAVGARKLPEAIRPSEAHVLITFLVVSLIGERLHQNRRRQKKDPTAVKSASERDDRA